jgi:uracil-DNA glycosylase family 4
MINMTNLKNMVRPEGSPNAPIVVIGSAPCAQDVYQKRPFCGRDGKLLDRWLWKAGLNRTDLYLTNLYPFKPPGRDIDSVPTLELVEWINKLHEDIARLPGVKIIVPLGNFAAFALTGKGKIRAAVRNHFSLGDTSASVAEKKADISKLRGSMYDYQDINNRILRVIPIIHPEQVLFNDKWGKRSIRDWERVKSELSSPTPSVIRKHIVDPDESQAIAFTNLIETYHQEIEIATDVETWGNQLSCVGFAASPSESITFPTVGYAGDVFMPYIRRLWASKAAKILCNGLFDWYWGAWYKLWLTNFKWDVQLMHHAVDPGENHSLDFLASIYCPSYQYWKDEAKDAEEIIKYSSNLESLWVYNGLDCCYTRELKDLVLAHLDRENMREFYLRHYQAMIEPLCRTMLHGFRIDKDAQKVWARRLRKEMAEIHKQLNEAAGEELFAFDEKTELRDVTADEWEFLLIDGETYKGETPAAKLIDRDRRSKLIEDGYTYMIGGQTAGKMRFKVRKLKKDFSGDKLHKFFYETLGLPKQKKYVKGKEGRTMRVSLDEGSIRKMTAKFPDKIGNWGNLLLTHREKKKELDYLKGAWDKDGRIRCSYKMLTEAGRLASSKNPRRTGYNLQNLKR